MGVKVIAASVGACSMEGNVKKRGSVVRKLGFVAMALLTSSAIANDPLRLDLGKPDFASQRTRIETAISGGKEFVEIGSERRAHVQDGLSQVAEGLKGASSVKEVDPKAQEKLLALGDEINSVLASAQADSRVVCKLEDVLGSNLPKRLCLTAAAHARRFAKEHQETNAIDAIRVER